MIERIAAFNRWTIAGLGIISVAGGVAIVAILATLGYALFPGAYGWVAVFHIIGSGAAGFYISRPFMEAWLYRRCVDTWYAGIIRPPLDVFDEEK